jgi:hypothetical protein
MRGAEGPLDPSQPALNRTQGIKPDEQSRLSDLGLKICAYTAGQSASARAVRSRSDLCASIIDSVAAEKRNASVLFFASVHIPQPVRHLVDHVTILARIDQLARSLARRSYLATGPPSRCR